MIGQRPDGSQIDFQTLKTLFNWALVGRATVVPAASGSDMCRCTSTTIVRRHSWTA